MKKQNIFTKAEDFFDKDNLDTIFSLRGVSRARLIGKLTVEAKNFGVENEFRELISQASERERLVEAKARQESMGNSKDFYCHLDDNGKPKASIDNYFNILCFDPHFTTLAFNEITDKPEHITDKGRAVWTDTDDAEARGYIENKYGIYSPKKYDDALRLILRERSYNPIKDRLSLIRWDGKERICNFLHKCMRAADNPYTREVSRLIFAGGIHRLYNPGCKFDDMPVLIGTNQGEGKSTLVRWLAMDDEYFGEVTEFEGQRAIESLEGAWICEVSELLAMTKSKDVEAVKSFITRQNDRYRMPFDKRVTEHKRRCIFIGTTNKEQFLTDKTGNRRFYPVRVWQQGYNLYERENEIKEYISQCWAEALILYEKGQLKPYADPELIEEIRTEQNRATQDDYRIGMIRDFLTTKTEVCIPMLWYEALKMRGDLKPTRKDSNEIALIMQSMAGWERHTPKRFKDYGSQQYWRKEWEEL